MSIDTLCTFDLCHTIVEKHHSAETDLAFGSTYHPALEETINLYVTIKIFICCDHLKQMDALFSPRRIIISGD